MKLIVDAGGTKTEWAIISPDAETRTLESTGVNAALTDAESLRSVFADALREIDLSSVTEIYYYGAGCSTPQICEKVAQALPRTETVQVCSDLLGAARALLGSNRGLAGILGTGSNTGLYDGQTIVANMPPLGFILGDEGSGTAMGRELLRNVYRFGLLRTEFESWLGGDYGDVLNRVYRQPGANQFLASLTRFVGEHRNECSEVINATFQPFFARISEYYRTDISEAAFVGGLADSFSNEIRQIAQSHGITITKIMKRPLPGLIEYHT